MQVATLTSSTSIDINDSLVIQCRTVYGRGTVVTIARFEDGIFLLEEHSHDQSTIIPLVSPEARERLQRFMQRRQAH
ncbi:MAG TPA: hypothetical protein VK140_17435 [Ktedonobacteraceae bacterium]|nr:hypothetical protein [Ktedonobacteraceae bacterium]